MNEVTQSKEKNIAEMVKDKLQLLIDNDSQIKAEIMADDALVEKLLESNIIDELKADIAREKNIMRYDWQRESSDFLSQCRARSAHTSKAYAYALNDFERWTLSQGMNTPLEATPAIADSYIMHLQQEGKSSALIRQRTGGLSAFYSALERKSSMAIRNIFRGTRALPKRKSVKRIENELPTENLELFTKDVETIIAAETGKEFKSIIAVMAYRGLRAGAFQHMSIHGNKFFTTSKGKEISGDLPAECLELIDAAGVKRNEPFPRWNSAKISSEFQYHIKKLYCQKRISYKYSAHDLRHYFALMDYTEHKDIYRLSKLLGHSSIAITEIYLKGLKVIGR